MTKPEIIAKLKDAGVEFDENLTKDKLEALLPKNEDAKIDSDEAGKNDATPVGARSVDPKPKSAKRSSVTVSWNAGVREYSEAVHGEDFEALAQEFATKHRGTLV